MSKTTTYSCDVCGTSDLADAAVRGIVNTASGIGLRNPHRCIRHICKRCVVDVATEWNKEAHPPELSPGIGLDNATQSNQPDDETESTS